MDHYAPSHDLTQPWRTRTLIATAIAAVELLALVGVGVVVLGKGWFQHAQATAASHRAAPAHPARATKTKPAPTPAKHTQTAPAPPMVARSRVGLLVLNGNGQDGAAGAEARVLRAHGYPVLTVTNAKRNDYAASIVMYRPGYDREARRLAHDAGIATVAPLDGLLPSQLKSARLAVIVGR